MLEAPDESTHLDYALALYANGGLLTGRDRPTTTYDVLVHPYSRYLHDQSRQAYIAGHRDVKVPPGYGSSAYFAALAKGAPTQGVHQTPSRNPYLLPYYPFGYYALLAAWISLLKAFGASVVQVFFGARIVSVALLAFSLLLSYLIMRDLHVRRVLALLVTAIIGFLPLTSFVSSYVQPDNLSLTMVSLSIYLALLYRRKSGVALAGLLGVALGLLLVTKPQFYICVLVPVIAMLAVILPRTSRFGLDRRSIVSLAAVLLPSLPLALIHLWVVAGSAPPLGVSSAEATAGINNHAFITALHGGPSVLFGYVIKDAQQAFADYYTSAGLAFRSFWGDFGWEDTPLVIGSTIVNRWITDLEGVLTLVIFFLTLFRIEQVSTRLLRVARRGHRLAALRIALGNPFVNSYFLFIVFMFVFFIYTDGTFAAQGRDWFPYLLPILLVAIVYAPKALTHRRTQSVFSMLMLAGFLLFVALGGYYAVKSVHARYYEPGSGRLANTQPSYAGSASSTPAVMFRSLS